MHQIGTGSFLTVTNPDSANVHVYAVSLSNGTMTVVVDNFQDPVALARLMFPVVCFAVGGCCSCGARSRVGSVGESTPNGAS